MTTAEACEIIVEVTRDLAVVRDEREVYRELTSVALTLLHELTRQLERERASRCRVIEEYRALREQMMRQTAA